MMLYGILNMKWYLYNLIHIYTLYHIAMNCYENMVHNVCQTDLLSSYKYYIRVSLSPSCIYKYIHTHSSSFSFDNAILNECIYIPIYVHIFTYGANADLSVSSDSDLDSKSIQVNLTHVKDRKIVRIGCRRMYSFTYLHDFVC